MPGRILIVQGGSAVGKTTLSRRLAKDLDFVLLSKDDFKELLYDVLGKPPTREESTTYGLAATKALYASAEVFLGSGKSVILESAFTRGLAEVDIDDLVTKTNAQVEQLYITASPKIRLERFEARIKSGERHAGHPSSEGIVSEEYFANDSDRYGPLAIDDTIEINTNVFDDDNYKELLGALKTRIEGK
jgi:predicted kinase